MPLWIASSLDDLAGLPDVSGRRFFNAQSRSWVDMAVVEHPLISIVVLCYNHERFVAEALDGVFAQTYSPLDIVIVDDGSQDSTAQIVAARLAERRDR